MEQTAGDDCRMRRGFGEGTASSGWVFLRRADDKRMEEFERWTHPLEHGRGLSGAECGLRALQITSGSHPRGILFKAAFFRGVRPLKRHDSAAAHGSHLATSAASDERSAGRTMPCGRTGQRRRTRAFPAEMWPRRSGVEPAFPGILARRRRLPADAPGAKSRDAPAWHVDASPKNHSRPGMGNRVWQPISQRDCQETNDLGRAGAPPTHPELPIRGGGVH